MFSSRLSFVLLAIIWDYGRSAPLCTRAAALAFHTVTSFVPFRLLVRTRRHSFVHVSTFSVAVSSPTLVRLVVVTLVCAIVIISPSAFFSKSRIHFS
ncbi:hypothetical protein BD309DRAFT_970864 [Dichomitus squalens]|nr:hypothetical protein BD309DRAFT_970864 [Dichomitus squalens]